MGGSTGAKDGRALNSASIRFEIIWDADCGHGGVHITRRFFVREKPIWREAPLDLTPTSPSQGESSPLLLGQGWGQPEPRTVDDLTNDTRHHGHSA